MRAVPGIAEVVVDDGSALVTLASSRTVSQLETNTGFCRAVGRIPYWVIVIVELVAWNMQSLLPARAPFQHYHLESPLPSTTAEIAAVVGSPPACD